MVHAFHGKPEVPATENILERADDTDQEVKLVEAEVVQEDSEQEPPEIPPTCAAQAP